MLRKTALTLSILLGVTSPAASKVDVKPTVSLREIASFNRDLDDAVAYSALDAGARVTVKGGRTDIDVDYGYTRNIVQKGQVTQDQVHRLSANGNMRLSDSFRLDFGGFSDLVNNNPATQFTPEGEVTNRDSSQVFSFFIHPNFVATPLGDYRLDSSYRAGLTTTSSTRSVNGQLAQPTTRTLAQVVSLQLGERFPSSRLRWTLSVTATRQDTSFLRQRYRDDDTRFDLSWAAFEHVTLLAEGGYRMTRSTQQRILTDADGRPVIDANGNYVIDFSSGRITSFDNSEVTYEGGLRWTPSPRTQAEARLGRSFGQTVLTGSFAYRYSSRLSVNLSVQNRVETGTDDLQDRLASNEGVDCRAVENQNTPSCLSSAATTAATGGFRNQSIRMTVNAVQGRVQIATNLQYSNRTHFSSGAFSTDTGPASTRNAKTYGASLDLSRPVGSRITAAAGVEIVRRNASALLGGNSISYRLSNSLSYRVGPRLSLVGSIGGNFNKTQAQAGIWSGQATIAARIQF